MTVVACYCPAYYQAGKGNHVAIEGIIEENWQGLQILKEIKHCEHENECADKGSRFCLLTKEQIASNRWETK